MSAVLAINAPQPAKSHESIRLSHRYTDAYRQARAIVFAGRVIKVIGYIFGGLHFLVCFYLGSNIVVAKQLSTVGVRGQDLVIAGGIVTMVIIAVFWIVGSLICARGQQLMASLDSAVNSSPFFSNEQRADVMSLN